MTLDAKRVMDLAIAVPALALSLPVQAATAVAVRHYLGRPVLFRQVRPGLHGEPFELIKFRTMKELDAEAGLVSDEDRLTPFGQFLRSTSLDEIPTLWNVVRGDMSIVGPRPLLMHYLPLYTPEQARRHNVRPGMTGLAQVSGRNTLTWEQRLRLDVEYVDGRSARGDAKILKKTIGSVLRREGISGAGVATMAEFTGTQSEKNQ